MSIDIIIVSLHVKENVRSLYFKKTLKYLLEQTIGESGFFISNGYKKLLRLPLGEYNYKIFTPPLHAGVSTTDIKNYQGQGILTWSKKRYSATISTMDKIRI